MPDLIKNEIRRIARRESNAVAKNLKRDVVALKRAMSHVRKLASSLEKAVAKHRAVIGALGKESVRSAASDTKGTRFRKDTVKSLRRRLGISQGAFAKVVGVSLGTVHNWESGTVPQAKQRTTLLGLRKMGARQVKEILAGLSSPPAEALRRAGKKKKS